MLSGLARLPAPSSAPGSAVPLFETQAARSLHAALLLQSLPPQALPFAPEHNFGYIARAQPAPLSGLAPGSAASAAYSFLSEKLATDERHEIIPARLCAYVRSVLCATQQPPEQQPAALAAQVRGVVAIFDDDLQPLVTAAAGVSAESGDDYAFLHSPAIRTGYKKGPTRMLMLQVLGFGTACT